MITFLGCGPANLFSVLYLLDNGIEGKDILIIDKGRDPINRNEKDILFGFGGAGFWSDGKYIFSDQKDSTSHLFPSKKTYQDEVKRILLKFCSEDQINKSYPKDINIDSDLKLRQSECWHFGTNRNKEIGERMYQYMVEKGVNFEWESIVTEVNLQKETVTYVKGEIYTRRPYMCLQIGLGKTGTNLIETICKKNIIPTRSLSIHVGGRFETFYNETIKDLIKIQYDFKLYKQYENIELRTFCVNNESAYVIQEKVDGRVQYNGHAYTKRTDKINGLTNFGILAEISSENSIADYNKFLVPFQENSYFIKGKNWNMNSSSINSIEGINIKNYPREISSFIPLEYYLIFTDFIESLNKFLKLEDKWCFFLPELKINAGMLDLNEYFKIRDGRFPMVSWVGDSCAGTRGIVPAAITGIKSISRLLNK